MEVISYPIENFRCTDLIEFVNDDLSLRFCDDQPNEILIPKITFLFYAGLKGDMSHSTGVDVANSYLLHLVADENRKCVSSQSNALITYFSFLCKINMSWDEMPARPFQRPTYKFKNHLESLYKMDRKSDNYRCGSTCKTYMRHIVNFYKYQILHGKKFAYPPFIYEVVTMAFQNSGSIIQSSNYRKIETTDLRVSVNTNNSTNGVMNRLLALSTGEWKALNAILQKSRQVIRNNKGELVKGALAIEFCLMFLIMRYSGLRRNEVISLNESVILKPSAEQIRHGYVQFAIGPENNIKTKNAKNRDVEIPSILMLRLHEYLLCKRREVRVNRYLSVNKLDSFIPVFLNISGNVYPPSSINARWTEVRRKLSLDLGYEVHHKAHNLRATYAVTRLFSFLNAGISQSDALSMLQSFLGHSKLETTLYYLQQVTEIASGDEKAEQVLNFLFDLTDDFEE